MINTSLWCILTLLFFLVAIGLDYNRIFDALVGYQALLDLLGVSLYKTSGNIYQFLCISICAGDFKFLSISEFFSEVSE